MACLFVIFVVDSPQNDYVSPCGGLSDQRTTDKENTQKFLFMGYLFSSLYASKAMVICRMTRLLRTAAETTLPNC